MDLETYTAIHIPPLTTAQLCQLARNICLFHKGSEWYRPPPKEAHNHGWDWFWFEKPMILKRLEVISKGDSVPKDLQEVVRDNFTAHARVTSWFMVRTTVRGLHLSSMTTNCCSQLSGVLFNLLLTAAIIAYQILTNTSLLSMKVMVRNGALGTISAFFLLAPCSMGYIVRHGSSPFPHKQSPYFGKSQFVPCWQLFTFGCLWRVCSHGCRTGLA